MLSLVVYICGFRLYKTVTILLTLIHEVYDEGARLDMNSICRLVVKAGLIVVAGLAMPALSWAACAPGDFTTAQADQGKTLYDANCASCHMTNLAGGAGPALGGAKFKSYLDFTKITGVELLSFITAQMPYQAPGSLKPVEYQSIFAYILQQNQYKAGNTPLTDKTAACIAMLPYPGKS